MKIPASVIIGALQVIWPFVADEVKEAAAKTETKWDDRGVQIIDLLLGRINPNELDAESLIGYFVELLQALKPDLLDNKQQLMDLIDVVRMTDK